MKRVKKKVRKLIPLEAQRQIYIITLLIVRLNAAKVLNRYYFERGLKTQRVTSRTMGREEENDKRYKTEVLGAEDGDGGKGK